MSYSRNKKESPQLPAPNKSSGKQSRHKKPTDATRLNSSRDIKTKLLTPKPAPPKYRPQSPPKPTKISVLKAKKPVDRDSILRKEIKAAPKHKCITHISFFTNTQDALPKPSQSFHVVEKAYRKKVSGEGKPYTDTYYFKHNTQNPVMSELEVVAWAYYHLIAPDRVPEKARAHYNTDGEYIGLSVKAINEFVPTIEKPITIEDIEDNPEVTKGLAIGLALSYFFMEDDLHRGNMDKYGRRIDFDMSLWPLLGKFKQGSYIDSIYRTPDRSRFKITTADIENFPDLKDAKPFYWPTKPQPIIRESTRTLLSTLKFPVKNNAFHSHKNDLYKSLKDDDNFNYHKFKTWLKCLLLDDHHYQVTAEKHLRTNLNYSDATHNHTPLSSLFVEFVQSRKQELSSALVQSKSFLNFLIEHGQQAKEEIIEEFKQQNKITIHKGVKSHTKHPERPVNATVDDLIVTEGVELAYSKIFNATKMYWQRDLIGNLNKRF